MRERACESDFRSPSSHERQARERHRSPGLLSRRGSWLIPFWKIPGSASLGPAATRRMARRRNPRGFMRGYIAGRVPKSIFEYYTLFPPLVC